MLHEHFVHAGKTLTDLQILGSDCKKMRLAAGLRPDPLRELQRSPRPSSWIKKTFGIPHQQSCFAKRCKNVASKMQLMYSV